MQTQIEAPRKPRIYSWRDMPARKRDPREVLRASAAAFGAVAASKSAASTPLSIIGGTNSLLWLRSDLGVTVATGVSAWADQSGKGNNATQATGGSQPVLTASDATLGNLPTIAGNGTSSRLNTSLILPAPGTTPIFVWLVMKQGTWTVNNGTIGDGGNAASQMYTSGSTPNLAAYNGTANIINSALTVATWGRVMYSLTNSTADYFKCKSTNVTGTNAGNSAGGTGISIFGYAGLFAPSTIAEVFIANIVPSVPQITALDSYAVARYGAIT